MSEKTEKKEKFNLTLAILRLAKPYRNELIVGMLFLLGGSGINLLFPEIIRRLLNSDNAALLTEHTALVISGLLGLIVIQGICFYVRSFVFGFVGHKAVAQLRKDLYASLVGQDIMFFDKERAGDLVSRLASDTVLMQAAVSINISVFIRYAIQVLVGIILMTWISPKLTLVIVVILPIMIGIFAVLGKRLRSASKKMHAELGTANMVAEETLYGIRTVKAFSKESYEKGRYGKSIDNTLSLAKERTWVAAFFASFSSVLMNTAIVIILWFGIALMSTGNMSIGDLTAFLLYGVIVAVSFAFLSGTYAEFSQALGAAERIFDILKRGTNIEGQDKISSILSITKGKIEFSNVSFAYPTRIEKEVLSNISFTVNRGESIALVGPSGGGKTTIVSLLLRYYDPTSGLIKIDDNDIRTFNTVDLRNEMAIVAQDPEIFSVTIEEILRYGKMEASDQEIREACKDANILDFVDSLPKKLNTHVGDKGIQLSGGQKQRLAIARAILKNPKILILDEATSALDSANEELVQNALTKLMRDRTTIVIAHRLSTVKNVNRILVLNEGSIVETGNHEDLIIKEGLYKDLVERQQLHS